MIASAARANVAVPCCSGLLHSDTAEDVAEDAPGSTAECVSSVAAVDLEGGIGVDITCGALAGLRSVDGGIVELCRSAARGVVTVGIVEGAAENVGAEGIEIVGESDEVDEADEETGTVIGSAGPSHAVFITDFVNAAGTLISLADADELKSKAAHDASSVRTVSLGFN